MCYEDAEELQLGAGQLVFRGLELMFTVVFLLLVAMVPFMECRGVVVLRWVFFFRGQQKRCIQFLQFDIYSWMWKINEELEDSGII